MSKPLQRNGTISASTLQAPGQGGLDAPDGKPAARSREGSPMAKNSRMIGNAVPVHLASAIAASVSAHLEACA